MSASRAEPDGGSLRDHMTIDESPALIPPVPEVHLALVRPIGIDVDLLVEHLAAALGVYGFTLVRVKLSDSIDEISEMVGIGGDLPGREQLFDFYTTRMDRGDLLRDRFGADILVGHAIIKVLRQRANTALARVVEASPSFMTP